MERISYAAISLSNGKIAKDRSHADIRNAYPNEPRIYENEGFVTSEGRFVSREHAMDIAFESRQIPIEHYNLAHYLISEMLWEYTNHSYDKKCGYFKTIKDQVKDRGWEYYER